MSSGTQPSRALLIAAGVLTQLIGVTCLVLALASIPVVVDTRSGMSAVGASVVAALAAIVCGSLVWRGRLVPLALAAGLDVGFGIGLPRGNSAIGAMLRMLPANDAHTAETLILVAATVMFVAAILCVLSVPSALKLRQWARDEQTGGLPPVDEAAPTRERPRLGEAYRPAPFRSGNTLQGLVPIKIMPTQVLHIGAPAKGKPALIVGVALTLIAIGIIVISAATGSKADIIATSEAPTGSGEVTSVISGSAGSARIESGGSAVVEIDAGAAAAPEQPTVEAFTARFHDAVAAASAKDLAVLFDSAAFGFGVQANDLAEGRDAVVAQLREDIGAGGPVSVRFTHIGQDGGVAWIAEDLKVGDKSFVMTAVMGLHDGVWTIAALHWAEAMPNATAYKLAREGELAMPDAIPNANDTSPLAAAMRTAFASKPSFVDARSTRADAFNFGSAPGERLKGGDAIRKIFGRISATIHLHDAVKVGLVGDSGGWGVANVEFTDADKDGTEVTQTFRVLAAWVKEDAGWRIVLTQWSNAR
jgi:ketosteroid isomerase-like protein